MLPGKPRDPKRTEGKGSAARKRKEESVHVISTLKSNSRSEANGREGERGAQARRGERTANFQKFNSEKWAQPLGYFNIQRAFLSEYKACVCIPTQSKRRPA